MGYKLLFLLCDEGKALEVWFYTGVSLMLMTPISAQTIFDDECMPSILSDALEARSAGSINAFFKKYPEANSKIVSQEEFNSLVVPT